MRIMFRAIKTCKTFKTNGRQHCQLPAGLLVEPISFTPTDVIILDLSTGCEFRLSRGDFESRFQPF